MQKNSLILGIISDTHGALPSSAVNALSCVDLIIHAGDIGKQAVLDDLQKIAPVFPVKGNMDKGEWADQLPDTQVIDQGGVLLYVLHDSSNLDLDPTAAGFSAVISGHTHQPLLEEHDGVLFINPGSATQPRWNDPPSIVLLKITDKTIEPHFVSLK
ncbi:MAG: metallophosphoesterase [Desulfobacteraceae bacterium]|nr:MAG: metallophosphoesterase [Desulfobacteraceae bacterium]